MPRPFDFQRVRSRKAAVAPVRRSRPLLRRTMRQGTAGHSRSAFSFSWRLPARLVSQLVIPLAIVLVVVSILFISLSSLISVALPVTRDTHIVLKVPISHERINYYLYALSTVDHRTNVVEIPEEVLNRDETPEAPMTLQQERARLGRALGVPIDGLVQLPPYRQGTFSLSSAQIWYPYQDSNDAKTRKSYWWPGLSLDTSRIGVGKREFWSYRQFVQTTADEQLILSEPSTKPEWEKLRPRLTRSAAFVQCPVAVINTTPRRGLATELAGILDTGGIRVVRVDDLSPELPLGKITYNPDKPGCAAEAGLVATLSPEEMTLQADEASTRQYRADIVWFVGAEME